MKLSNPFFRQFDTNTNLGNIPAILDREGHNINDAIYKSCLIFMAMASGAHMRHPTSLFYALAQFNIVLHTTNRDTIYASDY